MASVGSATPNWSLGVSSVSASDRSSQTFLVLSSSFPRPFLTPFLAVSSPCLYANHNILKDSRRGCRVLASLCCFSPACPCPPIPAIGAGAVTGGHRDSESWEGWDLSSKQPKNDEDLTKQLLWLSQSLPGHGRAVDAPISIPAGSKSLSKHPLGIAWALWLCLLLGCCFFPWLCQEREE